MMKMFFDVFIHSETEKNVNWKQFFFYCANMYSFMQLPNVCSDIVFI